MSRIITLILLSLVVAIFAVEFTARDMHKLIRIGTPIVSPAGNFIFYTVRRFDFDLNKAATNIELVEVNKTDTTRPLTPSTLGISDSSPAVSPDGKTVAFLSNRNGANSQIFTIPINGAEGDIQQLTNYNLPFSNLKWSADGSFLLVSAQVFVDCDTLECSIQKDKIAAARTGTVYDQLFVRHWDVFDTPGKRSHVLMFRLSQGGNNNYTVSTPIDLMRGMDADSPVPPFGGAEQLAISPSGDQVALTVQLYTRDVAWTTGWKIYTFSTRNTSDIKCITTFTKARTQQPVYSPNGKYIAYLAMDKPGSESDKLHLNIYNRQTGETNSVYSSLDISIAGFSWVPSGNGILADADHMGSHKLFFIDGNGKTTLLLGSGKNTAATMVPNSDIIVLARDSFTRPVDIYQFAIGAPAETLKALTNYNREYLSQFAMPEGVSFTFTGALGDSVQGWFIKPHNFDSSKTYPAVNLIHGGPESSWTDSWSYRWNPQLWAAHGYAVFMINFHGSVGFGQKFTDSILNNWGSYPYQDVMSGLEHVLKTYSWIDSNRLAAAGGSFGGYMVGYINGKNEHKYKCFVLHDGGFDTMYKYYDSDELFFNENEFAGVPWEVPDNYERYNPRNLVKTMNTPTLVIQGGKDYRITVTHGLSTFTALQRRGIESRLLYYPLENHWVSSPNNSVMWYEQVLGWIDKFTQ